MARSGGRSEWERQQAALRRELERQAREQARLAKEREKELKQQHLAAQMRAADMKTAEADRQVRVLDEVLAGVLGLKPLSFDELKVAPKGPSFRPGPLGDADRAPDWSSYAPLAPGALSRMFGGAARHERRTSEAQARFEADVSDYRQREDRRLQALAAAKAEHERRVAAARADAARRNAEVDAWKAAFTAGDAEAVESFVRRVLDRSRYPDGFPRQYQVAYRPENRDVVVEFELQSRAVIPVVRGYAT